MAAFNFPPSPSNGDTYTLNGVTYQYDGTKWVRYSASVGAQGGTGSTGAQGAQGHQGHQGLQGAQAHISASAPSSGVNNGDLWWESDTGDLAIYYNDGSSSQWIDINTGPRGAQGGTGPTGAQGATGSTGAQGATAAAGAQGATGSTGAQGSGGSTGAQGATGSLSNFTESESTSSPNNSVSANRLIATGSASNIDYVASPKGTGANLAQLPDGASSGGNKRGNYAVDWQKDRSNANQVASGSFAVIGGGQRNRVSGYPCSTIAGGQDCTVTGGNGFVGGGYLNAANGSGATVLAGVYNTAYQSYSTVIGNRGKTRWQGHIVFGATNDSVMGYNGGQQCGLTSYNKQTTDATPTAIGTGSAYSADTHRSVTMRSNTMFGFTITLVAGKTNGGDSAMWKYEGLMKCPGVSSSSIVGSVKKDRIAYDSGASSWDADVTVNTSGSLVLTVTGQASTTIRWLARIETTELSYSS